MRALLPDALLADAWRLEERTGLVVGADGRLTGAIALTPTPVVTPTGSTPMVSGLADLTLPGGAAPALTVH